MNEDVDFGAAIKVGWEGFTRKPVELIVGWSLAFLSSLLLVTAGAAILGMVKQALGAVRGEEITIGTAFEGYENFVSGLVLSILLVVVMTLGFMACILPGIALAVMLQWTFYCAVDDQELGAVDAMKESWEMAKSNIAAPIIAMLIGFGLSMLGGFVPFGFVITAPLSLVITAAIYDSARRIRSGQTPAI